MGKTSRIIQLFSFQAVDPYEIMLNMKHLYIKKANSYASIPGKIIRLAHKELSGPYANLINNSMSQCVFPDVMKFADVSPIYKSVC